MLRELESEVVHFLNPSGQTFIGRAKSCDIQPESTSISKQHAVITIERKEIAVYWLEDLNSRNGTSTSNPKNGIWIVLPPKSRHQLLPGDLVKFGHSSTTYILEEDQETEHDETAELGQEREPLNYNPEVLSDSIQVDKLSKELPKTSSGSNNRLQFSIEYPSDHQIHDYPPISVQVGQSWKSADFSTNSSQPVPNSKERLRLSNSSKLNTSLSSLQKSIPRCDLSLSDDDRSGKGQKGVQELSPLDGESFVGDDEEDDHLPDYDDEEDSDLGGGFDENGDLDNHDQLFYDSDSLAVMGVGFNRPPKNRNPLGSSLPHMKNPKRQTSQLHPLRSSSPSNLHFKHGSRASSQRSDGFLQPISQTPIPTLPPHSTGTSLSPSLPAATPVDPLTQQEISEIQASRDGLADGVRVANKILGGVAPLDEWKRYASTIISRLSPSQMDPVAATAGQGLGLVLGGTKEEGNPLSKSTPIDSKFKILITSEVISAVKREKLQDPSQSSVTLLSKVKNNLIFLLEYEVNPTAGTGAGLAQGFPCELFNNVLTNCIQLFHDKILSNQVINSLDRSVQSSLHSTPSFATTLPTTQTLSIVRYITNTILPKFQGLIIFNENWNNGHGNGNGNGGDPSIALDLKQIHQVNRYISSNLLSDIEQLLDCLVELRNNILKENIQLAKYIFSSPSQPSPLPSLSASHDLHRGGAASAPVASRGIPTAHRPQQQQIHQQQPVDASIESLLSGEFTADGELKIQSISSPHLKTSASRSFNQSERSPRSSGERSPRRSLKEDEASEEMNRSLALANRSSSLRFVPEEEREMEKEKKSLWKNTLQEVKKKQLSSSSLPSPSPAPAPHPPAAAPAAPAALKKSTSLWSEEKQTEFELKSKSVALIKRIHRKLNCKLRNVCFYLWKVTSLQQINAEQFEVKWKFYQAKHLEEIQRNEVKLSSHYKELLELKDQEIESLQQMVTTLKEKEQEERSQRGGGIDEGEGEGEGVEESNEDEVLEKTKELIKEKEQRIHELEQENEEVKLLETKRKNEIELRYLEEMKVMQEKFQFLEKEGREERLRNDQKIFLLRCEMSNQRRNEFNVKVLFHRWKKVLEAAREKSKRKQLKERQLHRLLKLLDSNSTHRSLIRAFYRWNKLIFTSLPSHGSGSGPSPPSNLALIASLKSEILSLKEDLHLQSASSPSSSPHLTLSSLTSQLQAERILNRELIATNLDLQSKLITIENRLVEILKVYPVHQRKQLVCEVLMERENEILRLRKENRTLKEQIRRLEGVVREIDEVKDRSRSRSSGRGRSEGRGKVRGGEKEKKRRGRISEEREESEEEGDEEDGDGELEEEEEEESEGYVHRSQEQYEDRELSKKDALKIIVKELRKLQQQNLELKHVKKSVSSQLCDETSRYQQQSLALQSLQQRSINLEWRHQQMVRLLVNRYDEQEIYALLEMVEQEQQGDTEGARVGEERKGRTLAKEGRAIMSV